MVIKNKMKLVLHGPVEVLLTVRAGRSPVSVVDCAAIAGDDDDNNENDGEAMEMLIECGNNKEIKHIDNNMIVEFCNRNEIIKNNAQI